MLLLIMLSVSLSIDALGVGIAYGIRHITVPFVSKILICFFSIIYSGVALFVGNSIRNFIPETAAKYIGVGILVIMGIYLTFQAYLQRSRCEEFDTDKSGTIEIGESLMLGLALSIDAIGVGVGSGLAGYSSAVVPFLIGFFQLIFLYLGLFAGRQLKAFIPITNRAVQYAPGLILLILAIFRLV